MDVLLWGLALFAVLLGFAGIVLPLLPGMPLLFGGLWLAAWLDDYARVGGSTILVLGVMALIAWLAEYLASALGVKRVGASGLAVAGAALGALFGLVGGIPGLIVGPVIGAATGEWIARRDGAQAARAGLAAGVGFLVALGFKLLIALAMVGVFAVAYFV
jgi:uncharacterized protein YqgC (DUF456 family)